MKSHRNYFGAVILGTLLVVEQAWSQSPTGNDNPSGVAGEYGGSITTGGNYDPYTGNAKRVIDDIVVPGAVGAHPLKWTRFLNTRDGGSHPFGSSGVWAHNYNWGLTIYDPHPWHCCDQWEGPDGVIYYPDGRRVDLWMTDIPGQWDAYDSEGPRGMTHRVYDLGGGNYQLLMGDGAKVLFQTLSVWNGSYWQQGLFATAIADPYGLNTTLSYDYTGKLTQVTEPAGRYLLIYYGSAGISTVQAWDGRGNLVESVNYGYTPAQVYWEALNSWRTYTDLTQVYYDDGTVANYTWRNSNVADNTFNTFLNRMVETCDDPRYAGAMKRIKYEYMPHYGNPTGAWGQIRAERNATTNQVVSQVTYPVYPNQAAGDRWETRGDGPQRHISVSQLGWTDWTDFQGHTSYLNLFPSFGGWQFTDARNNTTSYEGCGPFGALCKITHPGDGTTREFTYSDLNNPYYVTGVKDENGHWKYFDRDGNNRVWQIRYPNGAYETFSYNGFGQVVDHRMTSGGVEHFDYDYRGLKTAATDPFGNVTHYNYYWNDRLQNVVDPYGNATWFEYNQRGQVTKLTHQDGSYQAFDYDAYGNKLWQEDELRHRTNFSYDEYGRVTTVTNPLNQTTTTSYALDWSNPLIHTSNSPKYVVSPMNKNVVFGYDENLRKSYQVQALSTADEAWTWFGYDEVGNLNWTRDPRWNVTTFGYDARNRQTSITDALGRTTTTTYDGASNKTTITRPNNPPIQFIEYDPMNHLTQQIDERGVLTRNVYDAAGNLRYYYDGNGQPYEYQYDELNRRKAVIYPDGSTELTNYDAAGNVSTRKNRATAWQSFHYDCRNRPDWFGWDDGTQAQVTSYDSASRITYISNWNADLTFAYNDANHKTSETQTIKSYGLWQTRTVYFDYDGDGNRSRLLYPQGYDYRYSYTNRNQLATVQLAWLSDPTLRYTYDPAGNRATRTTYYGASTQYDFNEVNLLRAQCNYTSWGQWFGRFDYGFDDKNRRKYELRDWWQADGFQYDPSDEVTNYQRDGSLNWDGSVSSSNYASLNLDNNGNRTQVSGSNGTNVYYPNNLNQYASDWSTGGMGYDGKGNLTYAAGWNYDYDAQNRVTGMHNYGTGQHMYYTYDGLNRVITRNVNGDITINVWDEWSLIEEHRADWSLKRCYFYGTGPNELLFSFDGGVYGDIVYYQDGRGNITHVTDGPGNLLERYSYDLSGTPSYFYPWGQEKGWTDYDTRFFFAGAQYIPEAHVYDMRNRFYHPTLNRFLQSDPIGFKGDALNLYRYCGNDPVDRSDPTGLTDVNYVGDTLRGYNDDLNPTDVISVSAHGEPWQLLNNFWGDRTKKIDLPVSQVAADIQTRAAAKFSNKGMAIRLYSCRAGDWRTAAKYQQECPAQLLARETNHHVQATGADINPKKWTTYATQYCDDRSWYDFSPDGSPPTKIPDPKGITRGGIYGAEKLGATDNRSADERWARDSGTGNWQADQYTNNYLLGGGENAGEGFHPAGPR